MPSYNTSPFAAPPEALIPGKPAYCFGSFPQDVGPTLLNVTAVASSSTVLTYYVTLNAGNLPVTPYGKLTVYGLATDAQFNVTNATITAVTLNATTGAGTITVTSTGYNVYSKTADGGSAQIPQPEVGETFANGSSAAKGVQYSSQFQMEQTTQALAAVVNVTGAPTAGTIVLQGAIINQDSEYANLGTIGATTNPTGGSLNFVGKYNFYRFNISGVAGGTAPKIVAKIVI